METKVTAQQAYRVERYYTDTGSMQVALELYEKDKARNAERVILVSNRAAGFFGWVKSTNDFERFIARTAAEYDETYDHTYLTHDAMDMLSAVLHGQITEAKALNIVTEPPLI